MSWPSKSRSCSGQEYPEHSNPVITTMTRTERDKANFILLKNYSSNYLISITKLNCVPC